MRASAVAEAAGVPTVSVICPGFVDQALATGRGLGIDGLRVAVTSAHVDSLGTEDLIKSFLGETTRQVISGLIEPIDESATTERSTEPTALEMVVSGSLEEVTRYFLEQGWSDGLPFVPPTRERVEEFVAATGHDPWRVLGIAKTTGRDMTVWSVAVNAVMAGCQPEHLPVLLAAAEILADPGYGAEHSGNTTGADALMILDGPGAASVGFNSGAGALRDGVPANTAVGRWLRLYLRNVLGFTADKHDKATFGNTFRVVLAEDYEALVEIGWLPLSEAFGHGPDEDVLTMARFNSGLIVGSVFGSTPAEIVPYLADGLARVSGWDLTHVYGIGIDQYRPLLILSPLLARTLAAAGWSQDRLKNALFELASIPAWRFEKLIGEWSNLTAGRRTLVELVDQGHLPDCFAASDDPERLVPVVPEPSRIVLAVAGDPNRANAYVMSNDGPHGFYTSRPVDYGRSNDLVCRID